MRARVPRAIVAIFLPALAFQAAFPVMESFTTVYNGPTEFLPSLFLVICLLAGPAIVLAFWVRSNLLFSLGVAVFTLQSLGVAWEIATTDDAQAGLAALGLPCS